jgi:ABC-2 type transport system permease protein
VALHAREVLRNPWAWPAGLAIGLLALAFRDRDGAVALVSLAAALQSYVPPLLLVLAAPLLTRRETWAFWSALQPAPGRAFVGAAAGIAVGATVPLAAGAAAAALILGLPPGELALLLAALLALVAVWAGVAALLAALTLDATRALAIGLAAWATTTLAYGPALVGLATALADRPLAGLLVGALLLNPAEAVRVGLLETLNVPVLVGPVAVLLRTALPGPTLAWGLAGSALAATVLAMVAALVFARRDR